MILLDSLAGGVLLMALAVLVEQVIESLKPLLDPLFALLPLPETVNPYLYLGAIGGVIVCILWGVDLATALGLTPPENATLAAQVATGFIVGRGSNVAHDAMLRLQTVLAEES